MTPRLVIGNCISQKTWYFTQRQSEKAEFGIFGQCFFVKEYFSVRIF